MQHLQSMMLFTSFPFPCPHPFFLSSLPLLPSPPPPLVPSLPLPSLLQTKKPPSGGGFEWHIHFWLGEECSQVRGGQVPAAINYIH